MKFYGYFYASENITPSPVELANEQALIQFIKDHYVALQLIITDTDDRQLLLMRDGVDLYNDLAKYGIDLGSIFEKLRQEIYDRSQSPAEKPRWENLYDSIGLSEGEIRMRQRVKNACRAARTVKDVADLVAGTYFDAHFLSLDGQKWYRFFHEEDFSATMMRKQPSGNWIDDTDPVYLSPDAPVKHIRSSEDIHTFQLLHD